MKKLILILTIILSFLSYGKLKDVDKTQYSDSKNLPEIMQMKQSTKTKNGYKFVYITMQKYEDLGTEDGLYLIKDIKTGKLLVTQDQDDITDYINKYVAPKGNYVEPKKIATKVLNPIEQNGLLDITETTEIY